jgi:hypothetical protein
LEAGSWKLEVRRAIFELNKMGKPIKASNYQPNINLFIIASNYINKNIKKCLTFS